MNDLIDYIEKFVFDMTVKFEEHREKYGKQSVLYPNFDFYSLDKDYLTKEIHYHYAKWLYLGKHKKSMKEEDTLTNLANTILLLWIKLKLENE
jgi:hypothetical protein